MGCNFYFLSFCLCESANQQASKQAKIYIPYITAIPGHRVLERRLSSFDYKNSDIRILHIMLGLDLSNSSEEDSKRT
jgi:hypothetical protein